MAIAALLLTRFHWSGTMEVGILTLMTWWVTSRLTSSPQVVTVDDDEEVKILILSQRKTKTVAAIQCTCHGLFAILRSFFIDYPV